MSPSSDLDGHVALVTGGGSGIGAALSHRLAARGAIVVVADLDDAGAAAVAANTGGLALHLDVSDRAAWDDALASIMERYSRLDRVALNAGTMSRPRGTDETDESDDPLRWLAQRYEFVRGVNLDGVVYGILASMGYLARGTSGHIAVTASTKGLEPLPVDPAYALTKHAVIGLVRSVAPTLAAQNITIGAVCPGAVDTPMISDGIRSSGRTFSTPDHLAQAIEAVLDMAAADTGSVWISQLDEPMWQYEFPSTKIPPR